MISIIIPAIDEAKALPATLAAIAAQHGPAYEIILADGGSTDATVAIAAPYATVVTAPRGRASQMNAGARAARGEWLLFLHADTLLPPDALAAIAALPAEIEFGGFRHRFSGRDWRLALVSWLHNFRCRMTGVFYGDQAMFVRRQVFEAVGGFPGTTHLEDVMLSERLLARRRPAFLPVRVTADSRKFLAAGVWRSLARCLAIVLAYRFGPGGAWQRPAARFFQDVR